jgi:hypothetical protein
MQRKGRYRRFLQQRLFFSEEKNQKTFRSALVPHHPAISGNHRLFEE